MEDRQKETVSVLNHLIEICEDGREGYKQAAENIENPELQQLFGQYSQQRARYASELRDEVRRLGGEPEDEGSVTGALHRGWINIKSALTSQDLEAVVAECERGEDTALEDYKQALESPLPANLQPMIREQYDGVRQAHDRIRSLEISLK